MSAPPGRAEGRLRLEPRWLMPDAATLASLLAPPGEAARPGRGRGDVSAETRAVAGELPPTGSGDVSAETSLAAGWPARSVTAVGTVSATGPRPTDAAGTDAVAEPPQALALLSSSELTAWLAGKRPTGAAAGRAALELDANRVVRLPEILEPALATLAPALARARRRLKAALGARRAGAEVAGAGVVIETAGLTPGEVDLSVLEADRLLPGEPIVVGLRRPEEVLAGGVALALASSWEPGPATGDPLGLAGSPAAEELTADELAEALDLLARHPGRYRLVVEWAGSLAELRALGSTGGPDAGPGAGAGAGAGGWPATPGQLSARLAGRLLVLTPADRRAVVGEPESALRLPGAARAQGPKLAERPPPANSPAARALRAVATIPAYRRGRNVSGHGADGKLSANESPFGPAPAVLRAVSAAGEQLNRYPEEEAVREALATRLGLDEARLILTNGSDELCYLLARLLLDGSGAEAATTTAALLGEPCYQIDATASLLAGGEVVRVPLVDGAHDLAAMIDAARATTSLIWLPDPHNPTGVALGSEILADFLAAVPASCLVVLDQAYHGYAEVPGEPDAALAAARRRPNVLLQRTFSKDWGLAGLRVGYAVGDTALIEALRRSRPPFSVNSLALAAVAAALGSDSWRRLGVERVLAERTRLEALLAGLGVEHFPSRANFVTCRLDHDDLLAPALAAEGLAVRNGADLGLPGWTRITVGWPAQMAVLREVLVELSGARRR